MYLFIWLVSTFILYNKTITKYGTFLILWVLLNYWNWGGHGNPWICSQLVRSVDDLGTPKHLAGVWTEDSLVGCYALKPVEWLASELYCRIIALHDLCTHVCACARAHIHLISITRSIALLHSFGIFLKHTRHTPTSGPLYMLFLLPGLLVPITMSASFTIFRSFLSYHPLSKFFPNYTTSNCTTALPVWFSFCCFIIPHSTYQYSTFYLFYLLIYLLSLPRELYTVPEGNNIFPLFCSFLYPQT